MHVSCAFRNQADQEAEFKKGTSNAHWPDSLHNFMQNGRPRARALDLFSLNEKGQALWPITEFQKLSEACEDQKLPIKWGGKFKSLKDGPHFELTKDVV